MSLRKSILTNSYSNFSSYFDHAHIHVPTYVFHATVCQSQHEIKNDYRVSSLHHEFRRERKPDFAEEESVGKAASK